MWHAITGAAHARNNIQRSKKPSLILILVQDNKLIA
jgi:hypothetical protein